jgi:carboxypeptidase Taq
MELMKERLQRLRETLAEIYDLEHVINLLEWDQQTYMPAGGDEDRSYQRATIARLAHQRWTSDETGRLVEDLAGCLDEMDPASDDAGLVRFAQREYHKRTRVPEHFVVERTRAMVLAYEAWTHARQESNFARFQPFLERVVDLRRQYAGFFAPYEHIYDPLLDDFERGMKTVEVQQIFATLRPHQVALIQAIARRPQVDYRFLNQEYPEQAQWNFGVEVISRFGYDWNRGRQDRSPHPFSTDFSIDDVRITTRFDPAHPLSSLFSTMHEAGHAMYEQGIDPALRRSPLAGGASMAMHESQSRLWENLVGRSLSFWKYFFPPLQKTFPAQLGSVDLQTFYRGINKVQPSLIRVEADEATYNLHVMLRLELEIALMEGSLAVKDLPEAWNTRMQEYLGLTPPNDALGVLQDVHWSSGLIGYFPTYTLGNLVSVQLWEAIQRDVPGLEGLIEQGEFTSLLEWLRERVHRHGTKFEPQELIQRATGSKIDPQPYIRYLKAKFGEIYGL